MALSPSQKNEEIKKIVRLLVYTGNHNDLDVVKNAVRKLKEMGVTISRCRLTDLCEHFYEHQQHALNEEELNLLFRANLYKLQDMLWNKKHISANEVGNLTSKINYTIQFYRELVPLKSDNAENNELLDALLRRLYSTPEGIKMIEDIERELNNN